MNKNDVIQKLIALPIRYIKENKSAYSFIKDSGYSEFYSEITEQDIFDKLVENPQLVREWIQFSEDKRTDGWFVYEDSDNLYKVGHYPEDTVMTAPYVSDNIFEACSIFIKRESESLRLLSK